MKLRFTLIAIFFGIFAYALTVFIEKQGFSNPIATALFIMIKSGTVVSIPESWKRRDSAKIELMVEAISERLNKLRLG